MCGYAHLIKYKDICFFSTLKTRPSSESKGIYAAICYQILSDLEDDLQKNDFFISDGSRNLFHETHFSRLFGKILWLQESVLQFAYGMESQIPLDGQDDVSIKENVFEIRQH